MHFGIFINVETRVASLPYFTENPVAYFNLPRLLQLERDLEAAGDGGGRPKLTGPN